MLPRGHDFKWNLHRLASAWQVWIESKCRLAEIPPEYGLRPFLSSPTLPLGIMNDIPSAVVNNLIALGSLDDGPSAKQDQLLARLKPFDKVNRLGWNPWNEVADALAEDDLKNLVRGLAIADSQAHWCGGSVAGVIWAFRRYEARFPDNAPELADWVLARSENPFVPFGRMRAGSRSIAEFKSYLSAKARRHDQSEQDQKDARQHKRIRAAVRRRLDEERHVLQAAHSQSRAVLISQLSGLPAKDRLEHIAWDDLHSLAFYPASFAKVDRQSFDQLDDGTRKRLLDKLAARRKGAWKKLQGQLVINRPEPSSCR